MGSLPGVEVVDAEGDIQGHLAAQAVPAHGLRVEAQGAVQVPALHQLCHKEHGAWLQACAIELDNVAMVKLPQHADLHHKEQQGWPYVIHFHATLHRLNLESTCMGDLFVLLQCGPRTSQMKQG